jgi:3-carboxy-cis,cis-muconate cycloisomerase
MSSLFESFLNTSEATEALSDRAVVEAMLRFEAALARAQASVGLIDAAAAQSIIGTCKVDLFDVPKLVRESAHLRCLATPLVSSLRETVALFNAEAASLVHFGCADQDLVDTALALVTRDVLQLIEAELSQTIQKLLAMATRYANEAMLARTSAPEQSATSFGLVCCQWAAPLVRSQQRLRALAHQALGLYLGSTLVELANMQGKGPLVMALMATDLQLKAPPFAAHVAHDERHALACELGLLVSHLNRVNTDLADLAHPDTGELTPMSSNTGPNTITTLCMVAQAAAQKMPQQIALLLTSQSSAPRHASGQPELALWPELLASSHSISQAVNLLLGSVQVNPLRMRANLDQVRGSLSSKEAKSRLATALTQQAADLTRTQVNTMLAVAPC